MSHPICPICFDEILSDADITTCKHWFHKQCLTKWLQKQHTCPCCRGFIIESPCIVKKFMKACSHGYLSFVKECVKAGIDVTIRGNLGVQLAFRGGKRDVVNYLILEGADVTAVNPDYFDYSGYSGYSGYP